MFAGVTSVWSRLGEAGTLRNAGTPQGQEWGIYMFPRFQARKDTDFIVPLLEQVSELCMFFILQWLFACLMCGFGGHCILHTVLVIQQLLQVGERAYWACPHPKFFAAVLVLVYTGHACLPLPFPFRQLPYWLDMFSLLPAFPISLSLSYFHFQTPLNSIPSRLLPLVVNLFKIEAFPRRVRREAPWLRKQSKKQTKLPRHRKLLKLISLRRFFPQG